VCEREQHSQHTTAVCDRNRSRSDSHCHWSPGVPCPWRCMCGGTWRAPSRAPAAASLVGVCALRSGAYTKICAALSRSCESCALRSDQAVTSVVYVCLRPPVLGGVRTPLRLPRSGPASPSPPRSATSRPPRVPACVPAGKPSGKRSSARNSYKPATALGRTLRLY
jgi:hypothetical protein